MRISISIPDDIEFADLRLTRHPENGDLSFDWGPVERICEASNIDPALFLNTPEDNVVGLLVAWYREHRRQGGAADPVMGQILAEAEAEDRFGIRAQPGGGRRQ